MNAAAGVKPLPGIATPKPAFATLRVGSDAVISFKPTREIPSRSLTIKAMDDSAAMPINQTAKADSDCVVAKDLCLDSALVRNKSSSLSTVGNSTNIKWHDCSIDKNGRQKLLNQKGCVIWITGLSGSGKSTVACALSQILYQRGKLSYILDGDNVRHGLNRDLSFKAEDRAENIRRVGLISGLEFLCTGEVGKLFADSGVICIACLISPYRRDRDSCRAMLPSGDFIEVFMDVPLQVCEARDPKGLYKLARAGKIKGSLDSHVAGFTGIDDPYEAPTDCEIILQCKEGDCASPVDMAEKVACFLEEKGYLQA
ncbi:Adenylyl-sulfate kinase 1, chloroplastic [Linum perenne]